MSKKSSPRSESIKELVNSLSTVYRAMTICTENLSLEQQSLPGRQQAVVFLLAKNREGMFTKDLAVALGVTSSAITQLVDVLVGKNLVQRSEDASNRRLQRIELTADAAKGFSKFHDEYLAQVAQVFDRLENVEIIQIVALLSKIGMPPDVAPQSTAR